MKVEFIEPAPIELDDAYKINLKKFPYSLIFSKKRNSIYIIAVAHHHRKPEYWVNRRNK